ncbi:centrosomal protein of 128 kDa-like [Thunnus maccoyii]|uniref:centrosomal protein of 128 kDa-like n=1 Tax=Thunnus maccoyii TaxID=8240 RepID=UPI001C4C8C63|nr:centrosomal protein of 128 kDa-like [Thunnus maccoyii]
MASRLHSAVLGSYNWTRDLISNIYSGTERMNLVEQVEELKTQLQMANEHNISQEKKVTDLCTSLASEVEENKTLWDQIEYLTNELHKERDWRQQQTRLCQTERAKAGQEYTQKIQLTKKLEESEKELAQQKSKEALLVLKEKQLRAEFDTLTASYNKLCEDYSDVYNTFSYFTAEKEKSDLLQQHLEAQIADNANKASEYKTQFQRMKLKQKALYLKMEHVTTVAAEKERSLCEELEDLKIQLHQETSTNLEQKQIILIIKDMKDRTSEQREKSPAVSQDTVEEESTTVVRDSELVDEESTAAVRDSELVDEESTAAIRDSELVEEESTAAVWDSELVDEESTAAIRDSELVEEESTAAVWDSELVDEESTAAIRDSELVEEESTAAVWDSELVDEESTAAIRDSELVEEESTTVVLDCELVEEESTTVVLDSELQGQAGISQRAAENIKRPSFWKRFRHFLGLRKRKKKMPKEDSTSVTEFNT